MGGGRWTESDWTAYSNKTTRGKTTEQVFTSRSMEPSLNPHGVRVRESRDSIDSPSSNAIIIALDVTGSMSMVLDAMARKGLNTLTTEIYTRRPVADPHIMCMGVGDVECDRSPLQVTQFEADIRIAEQLSKIYLERGGGGNNFESYALAWYFAANCTSIDCFEKRGKKGYLFTIGDEEPTPSISQDKFARFLGHNPERSLTGEEMLRMASEKYHVFHVMVEEGSHFVGHGDSVVQKWTYLLGERALRLADHTKFAELVVSTIQVFEGSRRDDVVGSWDVDTATVIARAIPRNIRGFLTA